MPCRGWGSGGGEIKLLRAKLNLSIPILFLGLGSTKCQDPWECSAPSALWWLSAPCRIRSHGHNSEKGIYCLHRNWGAGQPILPETCCSLGWHLCLSFYTKVKVSWLLEILPWAQWSSAMEVGGNKTGNTGSAIDNAYLWLWKPCKQREKFLLPLQLQ